MINYIINTPEGAVIYTNKSPIIKKNRHNLGIIKDLCKSSLFTYDGYIASVQKMLTLKYAIPVYLSSNHQFFSIRNIYDYDNIWINACAIIDVIRKDKHVIIFFNQDDYLELDTTYSYFTSQLLKLKKISSYKSKTLSFLDV